jgi:acetyltransferase
VVAAAAPGDAFSAPPRSIAVVGASDGEGASYYGSRLWANAMNPGFTGTLYPVNPRRAGEQMSGHLVYADLGSLPEVPDLVVISAPVGVVEQTLTDAGKLGVRIGVVITAASGTEQEQRDFDARIARIADRYPITVVGPNSVGLFHGNSMSVASFAANASIPGTLRPGAISALSQSGAAINYMLESLRPTTLGYGWLISTGNEAGSRLEDLLDSLVDDPQTRVIHLFVEGVTDGAKFRRALLRARAAGKCVVALRTGVSDVGRAAVQSHTGRIASSSDAFDALALETGMVIAQSYEQLMDFTIALGLNVERDQRASGRRAVVVTTSGGNASYSADALLAQGWTLPPLRRDVSDAIADRVGQQLHITVDVPGPFRDTKLIADILARLDTDEDTDAVIVATGAGGAAGVDVATSIAAVRSSLSTPLYVGWVGISQAAREVLIGAGIPTYGDPQRAIAAAAAVDRVDEVSPEAALALIDLVDGRPVPAEAEEPRWRTAAEALSDLGGAGIAVAPMRVVAAGDTGAVVAAARELGYPVAMKVDASTMSHKSDVGGVRIGLADDEDAALAAADLAQIIADAGGDGQILVQSMASGVEVLVGIKRDRSFGPMLVLGVGGTLAELVADVEVVLLPTTRERIEAALERHTVLTSLLGGYRGSAASDREAIVRLIERVADWASDNPIVEADLNPVMAGSDGATVVDARYLA